MGSLRPFPANEAARPDELVFDELMFDIQFHPKQDLLAIGFISGNLDVYQYKREGSVRVFGGPMHKDSIRAMGFSHDGKHLYTTSADKSIKVIDCSTGQAIVHERKAHSDGINAVCVMGETTLATGDDNGVIKIWDSRQQGCIVKYEEHGDYVSSLRYDEANQFLFSTSGDGTLGVYRSHRAKVVEISEPYDNDYLCLEIMHHSSRVVVGTTEGSVDIFNWGKWIDCTTKLSGHSSSVDAMLKVTEDVIVTGCSDGVIRVVATEPQRMIGILGDTDDQGIEALAVSHDKSFIASCSHDMVVRFWPSAHLFDGSAFPYTAVSSASSSGAADDEDEDVDGEEGDEEKDEEEDDEEVMAAEEAGKEKAEEEDEDDSDEEEFKPRKQKQGKKSFNSYNPRREKLKNFFAGL